MTTRVRVPQTKTAQTASRKPEETTLRPSHIRVPEESDPLAKSIVLNLVIIAIVAGITLPFALSRNAIMSQIGWCIFGLLMAWVFIPFCWLLVRAAGVTSAWKKLTAEASNAIVPDTRLSPQSIMNEICRFVPVASIPTVYLVPGDEPALITLRGQVIITESLYRMTKDRELQWLFLHEVGHIFAGHIGLLPLAVAVPQADIENGVRLLMLPILPLLTGLEEWALWADVTADRLTMVANPDFNQTTLGILRHVILSYPEGETRRRISRFVDSEGQVEHGDQVGVNQSITDLLYARHDADTRITNLREWKDHPAYREALALMQTRMGTLPGIQPVAPQAPVASEPLVSALARAPEASESDPNTLNLEPGTPEFSPAVTVVPAVTLPPLTTAPAHSAPSEGDTDMPLKRLTDLGLTLPAAPQPLGIYVPFTRTGNLLYLCGQLPLVDGKLPSEYTGKVGASVPLERAQTAARQAALNSLAIIHGAVGLTNVKQIVRVTGYVSSASSFTQQPVVLNGASELLAGVFGDAGRHARVAVGVAVLPMDSCIEVEMIVEVN